MFSPFSILDHLIGTYHLNHPHCLHGHGCQSSDSHSLVRGWTCGSNHGKTQQQWVGRRNEEDGWHLVVCCWEMNRKKNVVLWFIYFPGICFMSIPSIWKHSVLEEEGRIIRLKKQQNLQGLGSSSKTDLAQASRPCAALRALLSPTAGCDSSQQLKPW